mgnify:CR=1 FL=1
MEWVTIQSCFLLSVNFGSASHCEPGAERTDCVPGTVVGTLISFTAGNLRASLHRDAVTDGDIEAPGFLSKARTQTQVAVMLKPHRVQDDAQLGSAGVRTLGP